MHNIWDVKLCISREYTTYSGNQKFELILAKTWLVIFDAILRNLLICLSIGDMISDTCQNLPTYRLYGVLDMVSIWTLDLDPLENGIKNTENWFDPVRDMGHSLRAMCTFSKSP